MRNKLQKSMLIILLAIFGWSNIVNAQDNLCQPYNMKDIAPRSFCNINDMMLIIASDGLWKSDGTTEGTVQINAAPSYIDGPFAILGNTAYFKSQMQIWKTDGTETGTVMVMDIPDAYSLGTLVTAGNLVYFLVNFNNSIANKLWKTDGTAAGTSLVKDIDPTSSLSWDPRNLFVFNDNIYFKAGNSAYGTELWKSDGTDAGTVVVSDVNPGPGNGTSSLGSYYFAVYNDELYYYGGYDNSGAFSIGLWKTDGTDAGTSLVKATSFIDHITEINGLLYFFAFDDGGNSGNSLYGQELWRSDGTAEGTYMVKDINPGSGTGVSSGSQITSINGQIVFGASDGTTGTELWASDGTDAGTHLLMDISPGLESSLGNYFTASDAINGYLYFGANDGSIGRELWVTDGTASGTVLVSDIWEGTDGSGPWNFHIFNGNFYFAAEQSSFNNNLWSCGSPIGIQTIQGIQGVSIYPNPSSEQLFIELTDYKNIVAEILNVQGQLLQSVPLQSTVTTIPIYDLTSGIYFVKIRSSEGMIVKKIIKE